VTSRTCVLIAKSLSIVLSPPGVATSIGQSSSTLMCCSPNAPLATNFSTCSFSANNKDASAVPAVIVYPFSWNVFQFAQSVVLFAMNVSRFSCMLPSTFLRSASWLILYNGGSLLMP